MNRAQSLAVFLSLASASLTHAGPTLITSEPDGKTVLHVQDDEVYVSDANKVLLHIQGDEILTNPADPAVLVIDDDAIRHSAAGLKLATFDGDDIRHGKGGKVMINYHHPDLCPDSQSNRIFRVDGPELTRPQLVAVLYALRPDMFKLTDAETAEQQKAIKEAGEESDRQANADHVEGKWDVLNASGPVAKLGKGLITFAPKKGDAYPATFDFSAGGGPGWTGVATMAVDRGDQYIFAAYGTAKSTGLCVYKIDGATLNGTWYPWYVDGDAKNLGTETLKGNAKLGGEYKIESAKAPTTGASYAGSMTITPMTVTGATDDEQPYALVWTLGDVKVYGIGIRTGERLYVASGAGKDVAIGKFKISNGTFTGDFFKLGEKEMGSTAAAQQN